MENSARSRPVQPSLGVLACVAGAVACGGEASAPHPALVTLEPADDVAYGHEDQPLELAIATLVANDEVSPPGSITIPRVFGVSGGIVRVGQDTLQVHPRPDFDGRLRFTYVAASQGVTATAAVQVDLAPLDDPPRPGDDRLSMAEDGVLEVAAADLLANDVDPEGKPLRLLSARSELGMTQVEHGALILTPPRDFNGTWAIDYEVDDGTLRSTGRLLVEVEPVNDPPSARPDDAHTREDVPRHLPAAKLLENDADIDGDVLTVVGVDEPSSGEASLEPNGDVRFVPAPNFTGEATIPYRISDGALEASSEITVRVDPVNDPPQPVDDRFATDEDNPLMVSDTELLANDLDVEGDALRLVRGENALHGQVGFRAGQLHFVPAGNFNGEAGFDYVVSDGHDRAVGRVTVEVAPVNDPPLAGPDAASMDEDGVLTLRTADLLANDTDIENDPLALVAVERPQHGAVTMVGGEVRFEPHPDFFGTAGFGYRVSDGHAVGLGTVTVAVRGTQDPPIASDDPVGVDEDQALRIDPSRLLANDRDPDGDPLAVVWVGNPSRGLLSGNASDGWVWTPDADYFGPATLGYRISDGHATSSAEVLITVRPVNDPPVAGDDAYRTDEDVPLTIPFSSLLGNDTDIEGDRLTVQAASRCPGGDCVVSISIPEETIRFFPRRDWFGVATFTYEVFDGRDGATGQVAVTVDPVNDPPVPRDDSFTLTEDTPLVVPTSSLTANDGDPDGDRLVVADFTYPLRFITTSSAGRLTLTPHPNFHGNDSFTYDVSDGTLTRTGRVSLRVVSVNDPPVVQPDLLRFVAGSTLAFDPAVLLTNDSDADGDALALTAIGPPSIGQLTSTSQGLVYRPPHGSTLSARFTYTVSDGTLSAREQVVIEAVTCNPSADTDGDGLDDCRELDNRVYVSGRHPGTSPTHPDTDGDGISDGDEVLGAGTLDLPALGAHPLQKDIFVEYDWFVHPANWSHRPTAASVALMNGVFAEAPVQNPDGSTGIRLHQDYGQGGAFTGGNLINDADGTIDAFGPEWRGYRNTHFASDRSGYFHYVISANRIDYPNAAGLAFVWSKYYLIGLHSSTDWGFAFVSTHELGHNLGLLHGGTVHCNFKPNYNSVMNYRFGWGGIDLNCDAIPDGSLDFSRGTRIDLPRLADERRGVCGDVPAHLDGSMTHEVVDLSQSSEFRGCAFPLQDHDDWSNLWFMPTYGGGPAPMLGPPLILP